MVLFQQERTTAPFLHDKRNFGEHNKICRSGADEEEEEWRAGDGTSVSEHAAGGLCLAPVSRKTTPRKLRVSLQPTGSTSFTIRIAEPELSVERAGTRLRPACLAWNVLQLARPQTRLTTYLKGSS